MRRMTAARPIPAPSRLPLPARVSEPSPRVPDPSSRDAEPPSLRLSEPSSSAGTCEAAKTTNRKTQASKEIDLEIPQPHKNVLQSTTVATPHHLPIE